MVADALKKTGLKNFRLVSVMSIFQSILSAAELDEETVERIRELIGNRNFFGAEELEERDVKKEIKEAFAILPELMGTEDVLDKAQQFAISDKAKPPLN